MEATAPVVRGLIDTPILIEYREGLPGAAQFLSDLRSRGHRPEFSQISAMALLAWSQNAADRSALSIFFAPAIIHPITSRIIRLAQRVLEVLPPPSPLTPDDAIVAATALEHKLPLYTLDPPKFAAVAGLVTITPY